MDRGIRKMAQRIKQINKWTGSILICTAFLLITSACDNQSELSENMLEKGVSKELADWRKENLSHLYYQLFFSIPENRKEAVTGSVTIQVDKTEDVPLVIDFRADKKQILSISVNGKKKPEYQFINEHIILPSQILKDGKNEIHIDFIAGNQSLNRNDEFLYTLLVPDRARTLFPCFDQPNLKAEYTLALEIPQSWTAVSNTLVYSDLTKNDKRVIQFMPTEPLSTYLFSFVAGQFQKETCTNNGRTISAYHRETDPKKLNQLNTIFHQVFSALDWLEEYTDIPYPFAKYDFVILPGFQYGGMEHTGATLYNDRQMFLNEHPTPDEELRRAQLIAHETSHMWFGDLVTMDWFNDVWTKEVFANYFAALITEPLFPHINHDLNRLRTFYNAALSEDRTSGTTAIQQPLSNLQDAGLIYGQIIYNKAPVMMLKMADILGSESFRTGIRIYLQKYAYYNATWDDLIKILGQQTDFDLEKFSQVWVKEKGMPTITVMPSESGFSVMQEDPLKRKLLWPQEFTVVAMYEGQSETVKVNLTSEKQSYPLPFRPDVLIPNADGKGHGFFAPDEGSLEYLTAHWSGFQEDITRQATVMMLYENYLNHRFNSEASLVHSFLNGLRTEKNPLIVSSLINYLDYICSQLSGDLRKQTEEALAQIGRSHPDAPSRLLTQRKLCHIMTTPHLINEYYQIWSAQSNTLWGENDYTTAAYELAIRMPKKEKEILATQRSRISNPDRLKQFDFISRACTPDSIQQDSLFLSLLQAENRQIEPYAESLLYYLNHPLRDMYSVKYTTPGLKILQEIQRTGDIFFPSNWVNALLGAHRSEAAYREVKSFLNTHPDYPPLLKNKILQAAYPLEWAQQKVKKQSKILENEK